MQAYALADIEVNYEIERIRAWRYRKVSEYMRRLNKDALFSATACRERYNALIDGTARIPTDMDDDPDTRRLELEKYRQSREDARIKNQEEKDAKEAIERKAKDEARSRHAQKAEETAYKRHKENEEKAQRAMDRAAAAQARSQRSEENITAKRQRNLQIKKQKTADANRAAKGKGKATVTTKPAQPAPNPNNTLTVPNDKITADTPDPRSYLSVRDLTNMCADRGIPALGKSQDQLLGELQDADEEWSLNDLKKMCRSKGLNTAGNKLQMKYELAFAAAQVCQSFCAGVDAAKDAGEETVMKEDE
jgi:flagellar biosynthesis GTPase FlhF